MQGHTRSDGSLFLNSGMMKAWWRVEGVPAEAVSHNGVVAESFGMLFSGVVALQRMDSKGVEQLLCAAMPVWRSWMLWKLSLFPIVRFPSFKRVSGKLSRLWPSANHVLFVVGPA